METRVDYCVDVENDIDVREEESSNWNITDKASADWALDKIKNAIEAIEANKATASSILEKKKYEVECWLTIENSKLEDTVSYFSGLLENWTRKELETVNKDKKKPVHNISLPCGKIGFKKSSDTFSIKGKNCRADNAELLDLIRNSYPEFVNKKIVESVNWSEFKKTLTIDNGKVISSDGEVMDIEFTPGEYEFVLPKFNK